jgi:ceramide glucosyltransferase
MVPQFLLSISALGLLSCTVFLILLAIAVLRFRHRRDCVEGRRSDSLPPLSLLKPLHGEEPNLQENIESFFLQDYDRFEIIFGCRHSSDPALRAVDMLRRRYPEVSVKVVLAGEPQHTNAKACSLEKMASVASSEYLVISDSDVSVDPRYLREVTKPFNDPSVGMVTCMYRGVPTGSLWSRLEALGMSVEMTSGVMVANLLEGMKFALGPTMAVRADVLEQVGGFRSLAEYCADDFVLGQRVSEAGWKVFLSEYAVDHIVQRRGFQESLRHQVRWMKSTRFSRPKGHVGTGLTFATPFGLLGLFALLLGAPTWAGLSLFAYSLLLPMLQALAAGYGVVRDPLALSWWSLYPLRDLLGFFVWGASFFGAAITWRGELYHLKSGGRMVKTAAPVNLDVVSEPASGPVAVDELA